jgi:Uma2 family endonuclease
MARRHAIFYEENFQIPQDALSFQGFRGWAESEEFPETGRIDYVAGHVEADLSPEDLHTHGIVKGAIYAALHSLVAGRLGEVFVDKARVTSRFVELSVEPDVVVVFWESLKSGQVRYVPAASRKPDRFSEMEGAPDVVAEVVSDSSEAKDLKLLPPLYAQAGVPELWLTDARRSNVRFQIQSLQEGRYVSMKPDSEGWIASPRLGLSFRLVRSHTPIATWHYLLEHKNT